MPRIPSRAVGALGAAQPGSLDAKRLPDYPDPVSEARRFGAIDGMYYSAKATEDKPPAPGRRNRNWFGAFAKQSSPTAKGKD
jgi:hypothetical protein